MAKPSRMWARASAVRSSKAVRRRTTSRRKSRNSSQTSRRFSTRGRCSTMASMMIPKVSWSWVCLYRLFSSTWADSPFFTSTTMRMPRRSLSSRMSVMPSTRFSWCSSAIFLMRVALFTW